uniref:oligosaccharide flippase family protein n=1 Tax=Bacteroides caecimuris TaxID=1796613 RepID=UPI0026E55354
MSLRNIRGRRAIENIARVYSAQIISLCLSLIMTLYTPKFLGVEQFSYWQLFLFYASYSGLIQLGMLDGVYLRYGGKELTYNEKSVISGLLKFSALVLGILLVCCAFLFPMVMNFNDSEYWVFILLLVYTWVYNISGFCGMTLQAINKFKSYTSGVILDKVFLIITVLTAGLLAINSYRLIICLYIIGVAFSAVVYLMGNKDIFMSKYILTRDILKEVKVNIASGINLMLSNISATLIVGVSRFFVSIKYPITTFGIVSFAFTLCGFILFFISQIGNAIYPLLKQKEMAFHQDIYPKLNHMLSA